MKKSTLLVVSSVLALSSYAMALKTSTGFDLYNCTKCHDMSPINAGSEFPRLEGQTVEYFKAAVQSYKLGKRHNFAAGRYMTRRLNYWNLNDATINEIAVYYNKLTPKAPAPVSSPLVAAGKEIYENGIPDKNVIACSACHGANGEGGDLNPRLAGQFKSFTSSQIQSYKTGLIVDSDVMKDVSNNLSDSEVDAVTSYIETL